MEDFVQIGYTLKPHGVKGEVKIVIEAAYFDDFEVAEVLFIPLKGQFVPFFIEAVRSPINPIIKFEEVESREQAFEIANKGVFLKAKSILEKTIPQPLKYGFCVGFLVIDEEAGELGIIEAVEEYPSQEMAILIYKNKDFLLPLNENLIQQIDEKNKKLFVQLPDGYLDLSF